MREIRPFIGAKDYELSRAFYSDLGFEIEFDDGELCLLRCGDVRFYLQSYYRPDWCDNTMMHVQIDSANDWYECAQTILQTEKFGDAKVAPPKLEPYGALVTYLWDPAGVLWHLAEWHGATQPG